MKLDVHLILTAAATAWNLYSIRHAQPGNITAAGDIARKPVLEVVRRLGWFEREAEQHGSPSRFTYDASIIAAAAAAFPELSLNHGQRT